MKKLLILLIAALILSVVCDAQHGQHSSARVQQRVDAQPLLAQALRLNEALRFTGSFLTEDDEKRLQALRYKTPNEETVAEVQRILDPYCLFSVHINPEARVKVDIGNAEPKLVQAGWTNFLVRIHNEAGVRAELVPESPNAVAPWHQSSNTPAVLKEHIITRGEVAHRFLDIAMYQKKPMDAHLSGLALEYAIVQIYSKDAGKREAQIGFNIGHGSQDIGFRNTTHILFDVRKAVKVKLKISDDDGSPAMASLLVTDSIDRGKKRFTNIYPLPSRRVAAYDEYPDFFFQPQVYRRDREHIYLAPGTYSVTSSRGPEYIPQKVKITIPDNKDSVNVALSLKRWIRLSKLGYFSGDHHVHAAGCSHYDSPEEGVKPEDMWRQALGEDLNISAVLTWAPSWYYQKRFFEGKNHPLSNRNYIMRYDVEVSGFPSSHAGHIVLLGLKEDDYPGTSKVEEWPSWTLPVLKWAKTQGAITGYAHSGWGLEPLQPTNELPNYELPKMDGIGANEYVVTVTQNAVDFYSIGDTPAPWELNMWYHTLNCGFRTMISGETDFPCITDRRVGLSRSYFRSEKQQASYEEYLDALKNGRSYVTEGGSHILGFRVNGIEPGSAKGDVTLKESSTVNIEATVAAYLPELDDKSDSAAEARIKALTFYHIEHARIGSSRNIPVWLIINGRVVDTVVVKADGKLNNIKFRYKAPASCWAALRIPGSAHSNPVFISVGGKQVVEKKSAEWCIKAVEQCWKMKEPNIRQEEKSAAKDAYNAAAEVYKSLLNK